MKILCSEHDGLIDVPDNTIAQAYRSASKTLLFECPVCQDEVLIKRIVLEQEIILSNIDRKRKESVKA